MIRIIVFAVTFIFAIFLGLIIKPWSLTARLVIAIVVGSIFAGAVREVLNGWTHNRRSA